MIYDNNRQSGQNINEKLDGGKSNLRLNISKINMQMTPDIHSKNLKDEKESNTSIES